MAVSGAMIDSLDIATKRFRVVLVTPDKVSVEWLGWAADDELMRQMNARVRKLTKADLQRYLVDSRTVGRTILGIYERGGGAQVGLYETEFNARHRLVTIDVLVDQHHFDLSNVLKETDPALLAHLAERFGTHKAVAKIVETYTAALRHFSATGWLKEGILRQEQPSADGRRRLDVVQFGKFLTARDMA